MAGCCKDHTHLTLTTSLKKIRVFAALSHRISWGLCLLKICSKYFRQRLKAAVLIWSNLRRDVTQMRDGICGYQFCSSTEINAQQPISQLKMPITICQKVTLISCSVLCVSLFLPRILLPAGKKEMGQPEGKSAYQMIIIIIHHQPAPSPCLCPCVCCWWACCSDNMNVGLLCWFFFF